MATLATARTSPVIRVPMIGTTVETFAEACPRCPWRRDRTAHATSGAIRNCPPAEADQRARAIACADHEAFQARHPLIIGWRKRVSNYRRRGNCIRRH